MEMAEGNDEVLLSLFLVVAFSSPLLCIGEDTQKKKEAGEADG